VLVDVMNAADIGLIEGGGGAGLALKPLQLLTIDMLLVGTRCRRQGLRQELEGDESLEMGVLRPVDHTHTPATELVENPVVRNCLANHRGVVGALYCRKEQNNMR
jgi:hypothetical protein